MSPNPHYRRRVSARAPAPKGDGIGPWPKTCAAGEACLHGGRIVMSGPHALWFEFCGGVASSWHFACRPRGTAELRVTLDASDEVLTRAAAAIDRELRSRV